MARKIRPLFLGIALTMVSACSQEAVDEVPCEEEGVTESRVFDDFKYPERYAAIVEAAMSGDKESIRTLVRYYSEFSKTDFRNLKYWSLKASKIIGRDQLTGLIIALASHGKCERAWQFVDDNYPDPGAFALYMVEGVEEAIDGKCRRSLK